MMKEASPSSSGDESSISIVYNVTERTPRVISRPKQSALEASDPFWEGNGEHEVWEENSNDSLVTSFDSNASEWKDEKTDEDISLDENDSESEDSETKIKSEKRALVQGKYKDPALAKKGVKHVHKRNTDFKNETFPRETHKSVDDRVALERRFISTRDTTRQQTVDVTIRAVDDERKRKSRRGQAHAKKRVKGIWPTQEALLFEALQMEKLNTEQLNNYRAYEAELSRLGYHHNKKARERRKQRETTKIIAFRSKKVEASESCTPGVKNFVYFKQGAGISDLFPNTYQTSSRNSYARREFKYEDPLTGQNFDTIAEYRNLRQVYIADELDAFEKLIVPLASPKK